MIEKADGDYDEALASLRTSPSQYPRDRVVLNQIGRILFLKREYERGRRRRSSASLPGRSRGRADALHLMLC